MSHRKANCPPVKPMRASRWSGPKAKPYPVQAHHLLCAVCVRGGADNPPCGRKVVDKLLDLLWSYPQAPLLIGADLEVARAHFLDVYEKRGKKPLPPSFVRRSAAAASRRKDLEVCRLLA